MRTGTARIGAVLAGLVAVAALGTAASAHVTVSAPSAVQGGYAKLTFRCPTEKDNASTVQLEARPTIPLRRSS